MKTKLLILTSALMILSGCTENIRSRRWGGTSTQTLPVGVKLVSVTWKDASLWVLTRPMESNDLAQTYTFQESSSLGLVQGRVIIIESK